MLYYHMYSHPYPNCDAGDDIAGGGAVTTSAGGTTCADWLYPYPYPYPYPCPYP